MQCVGSIGCYGCSLLNMSREHKHTFNDKPFITSKAGEHVKGCAACHTWTSVNVFCLCLEKH